MVKPGYKQTEIGEIPEDWEVLSLNRDMRAFCQLILGIMFGLGEEQCLCQEVLLVITSLLPLEQC